VKYVGEWKNGEKNGQGTYTFHDGGKYVGGWKDGKEHGQGTLLLDKGNLKETSMKGTGKMVNNMVKELTLILMEISMLGDGRMGRNMVREPTFLHL